MTVLLRPPGTSGGTYLPPEDAFAIQSAKPLVRFLTEAVQPPSIVYVNADDDIVVGAASSQAGEIVTFSYRLLKADGDIVLGQFTVSPANDRSVKVYRESLAEGFLLSVSCQAAVATTRGQTFARVFVNTPALGPGRPSYMLMADYVTTAMAPAFPNGRQLAPVEGPGFIRLLNVNNPAAGLDWSLTVPTNARWRVQSVVASFQASIAVASRFPLIELVVASGASFVGLCPLSVTATKQVQGTWAPGIGIGSDAAIHMTAPLPGDGVLTSQGIGVIQSNTFGIDAADQWSFITVTVEEWLDNV